MGSRWESSRRPLFVKTVWAEGHRHVLLNREDLVVECNKPQKKDYRRVETGRFQESSKNPTKINDNKLLNISTVRILLSGIRNFQKSAVSRCNSTSRKAIVKTYTIDVIPTEQIKMKNINDEIVFADKTTDNEMKQDDRIGSFRPTKNHIVYDNHFNIRQAQETLYYHEKSNNMNKVIPANFTYSENISNEQNNALSDRVMVWLDLAAQNGEYVDEKINQGKLKSECTKKRVVTAHVCSNAHKRYINNNNKYQSVDDENGQTHNQIKEVLDNNKIMKTEDSILKGLHLKQIINSFEEGANYKQATSQIGNQQKVDQLEKEKKVRNDSTKRQLHIFMPNIPNKSDCDSSISSKISTLLSKSIK